MYKSFFIVALAAAIVSSGLVSTASARRVRYFITGPIFRTQPQYPKSMRRSGLKQLGAVPAMGGVRSLPGWGGER